MVSYSFINLGGGFGISACCHANKLACLAEMIYLAMALLWILALSQPQCCGLYQKEHGFT
ncbi:hypothetical protein HPF23_1173 [Helicobacter pylori]|nr:hypothetical protein HPF23_1173 [Helicobacter pylori]